MGGLIDENQHVMRFLTAIFLSVMLLLAGFAGPLFHLHTADRHEHGEHGIHTHSSVVHTHLAFHAGSFAKAGQSTVEERHESDAGSELSLYIFQQKAQGFMPFLVERGFITGTITEASALVISPTPRAHDPPTADSVSARAPPA